MFLVRKAAWAGIIFILLTTGISGSRPTPVASGPNLSKEVLAGRTLGRRQEDAASPPGQRTLQREGRWVCSVSEPGRAFADFRRPRI